MLCPNCGVKVRTNAYGEFFCPNCGIISDFIQEIKKEEEENNYIG